MGKDLMPLIVVNFKAYEAATGYRALELAKVIEEFKDRAEVIICAQFADLQRIASSVKLFAAISLR